MQKREKILLAGLLGVIAVAFVWPTVEALLLTPFRSRHNQLQELQDQVSSKSKQESAYLLAKRELQTWTAESLPAEPLIAQRVYGEWMVDLARLSGFRSISPALGNISPVGKVYTSVTVTLNARATLEELATFLFHFDRTRVLHRIIRCDVKSPETEGNPLLEVALTAEGLTLPDAESRPRLFPRTSLAKTLEGGDNRMDVTSDEGFPTQGEFRIRIGREFLTVTVRDGTSWQIVRGVAGTSPLKHEADAIVELTPLQPARSPNAPQSMADYRKLLEAGPFTKPRPPVTYNPQLAAISNQTLIRGTPLTLQARVSGWDPADGPPVFELDQNAPAGMQIDDDGRIVWSPADDVPPGDYPVTVSAESLVNDELELKTSFQVTLRNRNLSPVVQVPEQLPTAWIGRTWTTRVTASDPDSSGVLTFRLTGQPPAGLTIDSESGVIRWSPSEETEPGNIPLTLEVSDGGSPPATATATLNVTVSDDAAMYTFLVGCLREGDDWTAWLHDRWNNRNVYLKPGERFSIADISGTVVEIDLTSMTFEDNDGRWRLRQDVPLRVAEPLPPRDLPSEDAGTPDRPNPESPAADPNAAAPDATESTTD